MEKTYTEAIYDAVCTLALACRGEVTPSSIGEAFDTVIELKKHCGDEAEILVVQRCATITWRDAERGQEVYALKSSQSSLECLALLAADIVLHEPIQDPDCKCLVIDEIANVEACRISSDCTPITVAVM